MALIRPLPVANAQQLAILEWREGAGKFSFSYPLFQDLRREQNVFAGVVGRGAVALTVEIGDERASVDQVKGSLVTDNYFAVLGVRALVGRTFGDFAGPGATGSPAPVAVLSYPFWQQYFGGDPAIAGKPIVLNRQVFEIAGVMPRGFFGESLAYPADIWIPVTYQPAVMRGDNWLERRDTGWLSAIALLKPGATSPQAETAINAIYQQLVADDVMSAAARRHIAVIPGARGFSSFREKFAQPLWILMVVAALVLLISCGNVANLMLTRAVSRHREIAVRLSIGASRGRLVWQLLTESLLLASAAGILGLILAQFGGRVLLALSSTNRLPLPLDIRPDARVLAFTALISLGAAVLFGLAPILYARRVDLVSVLKTEKTSSAGQRGSLRFAKLLVALQVGMSLWLVSTAGVFIRSLVNLMTLDTGFRGAEQVLLVRVGMPAGYTPARLQQLDAGLLEAVSRLPEASASSLSIRAFGGGSSTSQIQADGRPLTDNEQRIVHRDHVSPQFFQTMGITLRQGRVFTDMDTEKTPRVAVINETMARRFFPGDDPIGRSFSLTNPFDPARAIRIVGLVADVKANTLKDAAPPKFYVPHLQSPEMLPFLQTLSIRTRGEPMAVASQVRRIVSSVDANASVIEVRTLQEEINRTLVEDRLVVQLAGFFGAVALILACLGLYGSLSYSVARRTREIGIRIAVGAGTRSVLWLVLGDVLAVLAIGTAVGIPLAVATEQLAASLLFGLSPLDPATMIASVLLLAALAALVGYVPARRAAATDPVLALRQE